MHLQLKPNFVSCIAASDSVLVYTFTGFKQFKFFSDEQKLILYQRMFCTGISGFRQIQYITDIKLAILY